MTHPSELPVEELLKGCDVVRTRRGGPGGQHRNKVETAVVVTHRESGLSGEASEKRSQEANRAAAVFRLRVELAIAVRTVRDRVSERWRERVNRDGRIALNGSHEDYPAMLAEAMDFTEAAGFDTREAARRLGVTGTQLVKLIKTQPRALAVVNEARERAGLRTLR